MARRKNCASSFSLAIEEPTLELTEAKAKRSPALAGRANLLVFGFALIALCLEGVAALPAVKLTGIRVLGSKRFTEASVVRASGLRVGAPASPKSFRDAANRLAASGAFADVRYQYRTGAAGYAVQFRVADAKVFFPCSFENFVWFSDKELQSRLSSLVPLFTGEAPPTGSLPGQVEAALGTLLKERGIQGTIHHTMFGQEGGPPEAILFRVEGVTLEIRRIEFHGATHIDSPGLQEAVRQLLGTNYARSFVRKFAAANAGPLYWERGYLRVAFDDLIVQLIEDKGPQVALAVNIPVWEGAQYRLADIRWTGNAVFSSRELAKHIHLVAGEPVNTTQLQQDLEGVRELYGTRGYLQATVELQRILHDSPPTASYDLVVREGDLYRMGTLTVTGLDPSHKKAVEKNWKLRPGDPFDKNYRKAFTSQAGRHLPANPRGWNVSYQQSLDVHGFLSKDAN